MYGAADGYRYRAGSKDLNYGAGVDNIKNKVC